MLRILYESMIGFEKILKPKGASGADLGLSDSRLFAQFLAGNDDSLVDLFDRHNQRLYLYCLQFVRNEPLAEDIAQELWERVIKLRSEGTANSKNPGALFLTIARNLCLDSIRGNKNHIPLSDLSEQYHPYAPQREFSHLEEIVIQALGHLPEAQREVLVLNAYSGYSFDEIGEMLGESAGAIRTRAWRARTHLGRLISVMIGIDEDGDSGVVINRKDAGQ